MQLRGQRFGLQEPGPSGLGISALGFFFAQAGHPSDLGEPIKKNPLHPKRSAAIHRNPVDHADSGSLAVLPTCLYGIGIY